MYFYEMDTINATTTSKNFKIQWKTKNGVVGDVTGFLVPEAKFFRAKGRGWWYVDWTSNSTIRINDKSGEPLYEVDLLKEALFPNLVVIYKGGHLIADLRLEEADHLFAEESKARTTVPNASKPSTNGDDHPPPKPLVSKTVVLVIVSISALVLIIITVVVLRHKKGRGRPRLAAREHDSESLTLPDNQ